MRDSSPNKHRSSSRRFGFWFGAAVLVHAELVLLIGVGLYLFAPRDADLARALAGRGGSNDSIEVGMLDEDAARRDHRGAGEAGRRAQGRGDQERGRIGEGPRSGHRLADAARGEAARRREVRLRARQLRRARDAASTGASRTTRARARRTAPRRRRGPRRLRATAGWRCARPISASSCTAQAIPDRRRAQGGREARMECRTRATSNRAG